MATTLHLALVLALALSSGSTGAAAEDSSGFSLQPKLFSSEFTTAGAGGLKSARVNSGLELAVDNDIFEVNIDYKLQGLFEEEGALDSDTLSQLLGASVKSAALDQLLGLHAGIAAQSVVRSAGDVYRYRIAPGFSKSLFQLADVNFNYEYVLDKAAAQAREKEKKGYILSINGSLHHGRLSWASRFRSSEQSDDRMSQAQNLRAMDFNSRYQIADQLHIELSRNITQRSEAESAAGHRTATHRMERFGAAFAWSPSDTYSVALQVDKLDDSRLAQENILRSGTLTWIPLRELQVSVNYGDQLVEGARGLMFTAQLELDGS